MAVFVALPRAMISMVRCCRRSAVVKTIDEMLTLELLTQAQHREISAWIARARTPEAIMAMQPTLWRALERASLVMNIDADLTRTPPLGGDD